MVIILEEREEEAVGVDVFFKGSCLHPYDEGWILCIDSLLEGILL